MIKLFKPAILHEVGGREHNEDAVYPSKPQENNKIFLVCDGVGGQKKGEVASSLICKYFPDYFKQKDAAHIGNDFLEEGLRYVEGLLHTYINEYPECSGMASTLTILLLLPDSNKVVFGWVGDSRIYHIRDGAVLYQTKDHSEVQSLIDMGEISQEEAASHPRKNVITRAVNGRREARLDQKIIETIEPNDFFLLCTDGILEHLGAKEIKDWFKESATPEAIKTLVYENAKGRTKDNFSMYLLKVKEIQTLGYKHKLQSVLKKLGI
ncbi:PP2C family protein-serine/threonine phosphatase [Ascidiimonas sp. W6]|uniref:PP2C family protein-serine/threonine phosphatase n=1 Tax=Ascidiimonas meishanensis TaxID=3128903 RepID=UPI0030ECBD8A